MQLHGQYEVHGTRFGTFLLDLILILLGAFIQGREAKEMTVNHKWDFYPLEFAILFDSLRIKELPHCLVICNFQAVTMSFERESGDFQTVTVRRLTKRMHM